MTITSYIFAAYLKCPTKCWLQSIQEPSLDNSCAKHTQPHDIYREAQIRQLLSTTPKSECMISPSADSLRTGNWRLATGVLARTPNLEAHLDAVQHMPSEGRRTSGQFIPYRFVPTNKLSTNRQEGRSHRFPDPRPGAEDIPRRARLYWLLHPAVRQPRRCTPDW